MSKSPFSYIGSFDEAKFLDKHEKFKRVYKNTLDLKSFNYMTITYNSTKLEGNVLTQIETSTAIKKGIFPEGKEKYALMVTDHWNALVHVLYLANNKIHLTNEVLESINQLILKNNKERIDISSDHGETKWVLKSDGKIRTYPNYWEINKHTIKEFMPYHQISKALKEVFSKANNSCKTATDLLEIYQVGIQLHYDVISIHPFADGNSRTSRLLMNYVQEYHNQPLTTVLEQFKELYVYALRCSWHDNDITPFQNFIFNATMDYFDYITKRSILKGKGL